MKSSSDLIAQNVYSVNAFYTKKQNETKELFFKCLKDKKSLEYFDKKLSKIWDNVDHRFMDKQIYKLKQLVHSNNVEEFLNLGRFTDEEKNALYEAISDWVIDDEYFKLTPETEFKKFEQKFKDNVLKQFERSMDMKGLDEQTYLLKKLDSYDKNINQRITYFNKVGEPVRQVQ